MFAFTEQDQLAVQGPADLQEVLFLALGRNADSNGTGETRKVCHADKDGRADDLVTARTDRGQLTVHNFLHMGEGFRGGNANVNIAGG